MDLLLKSVAVFAVLASLFGCTPFVPVEDLSEIPQDIMLEAMRIRIFTIENSTSYPQIETVLGEVTAYSCQFGRFDPPASKGDALKRLRLEALLLGADGIIDVTFDIRGRDPFGTNCWETVQASGQGVKLLSPSK